MRKKGLNEIIVIVLIILIAIVAVVIVWSLLSRTIKTNSDWNTARFSVSLTTENINLSQDILIVPVTRNVGQGEVYAIQIVFKNATSSWTYENNTNVPKELETVFYTVNLSGHLTNPISFEVYPLFITDSGRKVVGMKADVSNTGWGGGGGGTTPGPGCTNTCSPAGNRTCEGNSYKTCLSSGGCLAWSSPVSCGANHCVNGSCVECRNNTDCGAGRECLANNSCQDIPAQEEPPGIPVDKCYDYWDLNGFEDNGVYYLKNSIKPDYGTCFYIYYRNNITLDLRGFNISQTTSNGHCSSAFGYYYGYSCSYNTAEECLNESVCTWTWNSIERDCFGKNESKCISDGCRWGPKCYWTGMNWGVIIESSNNITIKNGLIEKASQGVAAYSSSGIRVENMSFNYVDGGVRFAQTNNGVIKNNRINKINRQLQEESYLSIYYNYDAGIYIKESRNNIVTNNTISNASFNSGFITEGWEEGDFNNTIDELNTINNKSIYYSFGLSNSKWNIKNPALIFCAKCNNVTISNIDLKNSEAIYGIYFFNTTNSTISNISVLYNKLPAVYMYQGGRNSITNLNGSYNGDDTSDWVEAGIVLDSSNSNYIFNASLSGYPNGIFGYYSTNNTIAKSILRNSEKEGIYLEKSNYTNITESILENNAYDGIVLLYTTRTNFSKNTVRNNTENGILLSYGGFGDFIFNNTVTNSSVGINIDQSTESDKILSNTVENNSYYGIKTGYSSSNLEISDNRVCNSSSWDFYCSYWPGANKFSNNRCYFNRVYNCNQSCLAC